MVELEDELKKTHANTITALMGSGQLGYNSPDYLNSVEAERKISEEIADQEAQLEKLEKAFNQAQSSAEKYDSQISAIKQNVGTLSIDKEKLELKIADGEELKKQNDEVADLEKKFDAVADKVEDYDTKIRDSSYISVCRRSDIFRCSLLPRTGTVSGSAAQI